MTVAQQTRPLEELAAAVRQRRRRGDGAARPGSPTLDRPKREGQGDYSTNAAMLLAPALGAPPREIAERIAAQLSDVLGDELDAGRGRRARLPEPVCCRTLGIGARCARCSTPVSGSAPAAAARPERI